MKICLKKKLNLGKITLQKHEEGHLLGISWNETGDFTYYVDFNKAGCHNVDAKDCDVLNLPPRREA